MKPAIGRPQPPPEETWVYVVTAILIILSFVGYLVACELLYGDWRCALAQCRIEVGK